MEKRLNEAALGGNASSLLELLQEDALILDRVMVSSVADNPLHIASILGHVDFAREILSRKPELACELNSQGSSSLHLASAKGHVEIVKELLKINADVCLLRDQYGRTPLHVAAIKGQVGAISELIHAKPDSPWDLTDEGETTLHLCVKYHQLEAIKLLVQSVDNQEYLQSKDKDGNSVLHLAVARRHIQMTKFLLGTPGVNALNENGVTVLDVLIQSPTQLCDIEIGEILRGAGAVRARDLSWSARNQILANHQMVPPQQSPVLPQQQSRWKKKNSSYWLEKYGNTLMVVAILIATMTFEAGMNPPKEECAKFMLVDTIGFLSSVSIIVLMISGFPFWQRYLRLVLMVTMMIAIFSVVWLFSYWMVAIRPHGHIMINILRVWLVFVSLLFLWQFVRFGKWFVNECGIIGKKEMTEEEEAMV